MSKPLVFISYSHKDIAWKDRLLTHLKVFEKQGILETWSDREISAGEDWHNAIVEGIERASIALLLISANFLTSQFILSEELPKLLERREKEGLRIIPVLLRPCAWNEVYLISKMLVFPRDGQPLSSMTEHETERELAILSTEIVSILKDKSKEKISSDISETYVETLKGIDERLKRLEKRQNEVENELARKRELSRKIFIIHGHDEVLKYELARFLEKLNFDPIVLHEQPDRGQTIFSKLKNEMEDVGFAFVLLTPDDIGSPVNNTNEQKMRARQNVIFEHGLLIGNLGQNRVCAIRKGSVELPSDLHGVIYKYIPINGSISNIALDLISELRAAGYEVDANLL